LATCSGNLGAAASIALITMKRPRAIIIVTSFETVLTVALVWILMTGWGLFGAACGILVVSVTGAIGRWTAFYVTAPKVSDTAPVVHVLQEFTKCRDTSRWMVTRMSGQEDAEVFAISSIEPHPIWNRHESVVVKLIKLETSSPFDVMHAQDRLHEVLDGNEINGWRVSVPRSLHVCTSPSALIMTTVPGEPIGSYAARNDVLTSQAILDAARTFAMAMEQYWSSGRRHGDLNFGNALLDLETKRISFIDAGTRADCRVCSDVTKFTSAIVCDLAHFLWEVAHDLSDLVRDIDRSQTARLSDEMFAETILRVVVDHIDSPEKKRQLLSEIWICAQHHINDKLHLPWSVRGALNIIVNRVIEEVARRRIHSILERVSFHGNLSVVESREDACRG
jgi:hypothetical protein